MTLEARLNRLEQRTPRGTANALDPPLRIYLPVKDGAGRGQEAPPSVAQQLAEGRQIVLYRPGELPD